MLRRALSFSLISLTLACAGGDPPRGLRPTPPGTGPRVVWDVDKLPLPEIPLPNDFALRIDPSSPTGRRLNISMLAPTALEAKLRRRAARLDGFGTFAPITAKFDALLDLADLAKRQRDNDDLADDAVFVIDVTPGSPTFGQAAPLDFGRGNYPGVVPDTHFYFAHDPRDGASSLMFETVEEDVNGNGVFDPGEDTDGDGVFDHPNVFPRPGRKPGEPLSPIDDLLVWYERETNTLLMRPVRPLREQTRYAVVFTTRLRGEKGEPVRSPFEYTTIADQTPELEPLSGILPRFGLTVDDVAFAWTFTTQSVTLDLRMVRAGLYGSGPFARFATEFPATYELNPLRSDGKGSKWIIGGKELDPVAEAIAGQFGLGGGVKAAMLDSFRYIDRVVFGTFPAPDFMIDRDGLATPEDPQNDDESWDLDPVTGQATYGTAQVPFVCTIPKAGPGMKQPFPVTLHTSGTGVPKLGGLAYAGWHARQGLATCAIDAFGHGLALPPEGGLFSIAGLQPVVEALGFGPIVPALTGNRARDLDNDGIGDSGGDFWSPDPFHSRDTVRQTVSDWLQFVRVLRSFDGVRRGAEDHDGDGQGDVAGDFDGDGTPDLGTEAGRYSAWGISLGGIVTGVFAGVEPKLDAAVPQSGGGGLTELAMRSNQPGVPEMVIFGSWGPMVMGERGAGGETMLNFMLPHLTNVDIKQFGTLTGIEPKDWVTVTNLRSGEKRHALVQPDGAFRLGVPADALLPSALKATLGLKPLEPGFKPPSITETTALGDPLELVITAPDGTVRGRVATFEQDVTWAGVTWAAGAPLVAITRGLGRARQTPDFRILGAIAQTILEPADPANYATHYHLDPLSFPYDPDVEPGCNVLDLVTVGDPNVPAAAGINIARAAGIVDDAQMKVLIDNAVVEGVWRLARFRTNAPGFHDHDPTFDYETRGAETLLFDVDDLDEGTDGFDAPSPETPLRATVDTGFGKSGLRIVYTRPHGSHGVNPPDLGKPFSAEMYGVNLMTRFMVSNGADLPDDLCLADNSCAYILAEPPTP